MKIQEQCAVDEFVSIREIVELIAAKKEVDIETVAGYIHRKLDENCSASKRPKFFAIHRIEARLIERGDDFVLDRLREIERSGLFFEMKTGDGFRYCSDFGFVREEVFNFLGLPIPHVAPFPDANLIGIGIAAKADETAEQRRSRIVTLVNENKAKGIPKEESFKAISTAEKEPCTPGNIKRIYLGKK